MTELVEHYASMQGKPNKVARNLWKYTQRKNWIPFHDHLHLIDNPQPTLQLNFWSSEFHWPINTPSPRLKPLPSV